MTRQELYARRQRKKKAAGRKKIIMAGISLLLILAVVLVVKAGIAAGRRDAAEEPAPTALPEEVREAGDTASLLSVETETGNTGWNMDGGRWWYKTADNARYVNGWKTIDGDRYYFDEEGYTLTGWHILDDGSYCCFSDSGIYKPDEPVKYVALTFDDGPSRETAGVLDVLEANKVKATFFVVCKMAAQDEETKNNLIRAYNLGMELGSHTWDHTTLVHQPAEVISSVMQQNDAYLQQLFGYTPALMRPTGGGIDDTVSATVGKPMILWNVDTLDWDTRDPAQTIAAATTNIKDGSIILMHDIYSETVEAVQTIVPTLLSEGYMPVTVSELAAIKGVTMQPGVAYGSFTAES